MSEDSGEGQHEDTEARVQALLEVTTSLLALDDEAQLRKILNAEHSADVADVLRRVDEETRQILFSYLEDTHAADTLVETDLPTLRTIVGELAPEALTGLVEEMQPDDAVDVLSELEEAEAAQVLGMMEKGDAEALEELLTHEEDTGGGLMTPDFVLVNQDATVGDALKALQEDDETADLFYVFVVDDEQRPVGAISIHKLVRAKPQQKINTIMNRDVATVSYDTDQEEIAKVFERYNLMAMPVVDENGRLAGRITVDDVMDVIEEENAEDLYKMAGTSQEEVYRPSIFGIAKARMPWLFIGMMGSLFAGGVIESFKMTLEEVFTLAAFLPVIMATGGSSGLQACTVTVRGLVTGNVSAGLIFQTIAREIMTAMLIGIVCGGGASLVAWGWFGEAVVGVCVGISMFLVISLAVFMGVSAPMIFHKLNVDPAIVSGPFITISNDIVGVFIYLKLATVMLAYFG